MSGSSHKFHEKTFTKLTYCDYCTKLLWGVAKQGVTCDGCHFNCHKKCSELVYDNCIRSMHIPSPDNLKRPGTSGPDPTGTKTSTTKKIPARRVNSDGGMRVSIPPAIVSSSQPLQSLVERPLRQPRTPASEQDSEVATAQNPQGRGLASSSSPPSSPVAGRASFLENAIISAAIRMTLPSDISALPKNDHPPLTIQATTINFTRFVHKTTAVFWFQDQIEDIFTWKDPWNTTFVLVLYCFVSIMATIMIYFFQQKSARQQHRILGIKPRSNTVVPPKQHHSPEDAYIEEQEKRHHNRYHVYHDEDYLDHAGVSSSDDEEERRSTGVQYLSNLQHIQNMMGDISDAHDVIKPLFKHLDWSDEAEAIMIVQGTILAFVGMSVVMWFVPWRWVFMLGGAGSMLANSPWGKVITKELVPLGKDIAAWAQVQAQAYKQKRMQEL
ncbi:hypothetical protein BGZ65_009077 [Modicella reniformis]|uniref:Phorbol-ester/DAG-type domain-containing protein n=1 Tax=Modicella reniformis TaxID=1440133 RepID=A0A9P6SVB2_9FUNG|nr:hypothetical protein BGZ65_009077 [Modicella reniformis]